MAVGLALLVSADPVTIRQFSHALQSLSISPEVCEEVPAAIGLLNGRKFEALFARTALGPFHSHKAKFLKPKKLLLPGYSMKRIKVHTFEDSRVAFASIVLNAEGSKYSTPPHRQAEIGHRAMTKLAGDVRWG
jgi:hypothetical protein